MRDARECSRRMRQQLKVQSLPAQKSQDRSASHPKAPPESGGLSPEPVHTRSKVLTRSELNLAKEPGEVCRDVVRLVLRELRFRQSVGSSSEPRRHKYQRSQAVGQCLQRQ